MARFFFDELARKLRAGAGAGVAVDVSVRRVRVWEAPAYSASYGVE